MTFPLEKFITPKLLLVLNILIILAAEFIGKGELFFTTGIIHGIAIILIVLVAARAFSIYYFADPYLTKFIHINLFAFGVFALSHFLEFLSYRILKMPDDVTFGGVIDFYLISLAAIILASELYLRLFSSNRTKIGITFLGLLITALVVHVIAIFINNNLISLGLDSPMTPIYLGLMTILAIYGFASLNNFKKVIPHFKSFVHYQLLSLAMITFSILINIFYEVLEKVAHLPEFQIIYIAHFAFYASLSVMFISFGKLHKLGGVLSDVDELINNKKGGALK